MNVVLVRVVAQGNSTINYPTLLKVEDMRIRSLKSKHGCLLLRCGTHDEGVAVVFFLNLLLYDKESVPSDWNPSTVSCPQTYKYISCILRAVLCLF